MGIIDDYFDGYYSEEMIESQVTFHCSIPSCLGLLAITFLVFLLFIHLNQKYVVI